MKALRLPDKLRSELKNPLGKLYRGSGSECIMNMSNVLRSATKVVAVGDITTFCLIESSFIPDLCIVDNKTKRKPAPDHVTRGIEETQYKTIEVVNPPATITQELIDIIKDTLAGDSCVRVLVDGEEDLAALPAIMYGPPGSVVIYGQPNEGSVLVEVTPEKKEHVKTIMDKMIVED